MNCTHDDLGDDFWLPEWPENQGEQAAEDENEGGLNYEKWEGKMEGIVPLPKPIGGGLDGDGKGEGSPHHGRA
ncbi:uncharacterized protein A4U43_C07F2550 [Asparagus officinalis]|uniref:Uncharacterized protein n=1 Tax=Asparagus officinalis TaxID=4686 RepID=A0A5P1EAS5_ASPOF|nr:uncharacterized protein A4U43_C07F2550 [Asparagus officinalis]